MPFFKNKGIEKNEPKKPKEKPALSVLSALFLIPFNFLNEPKKGEQPPTCPLCPPPT